MKRKKRTNTNIYTKTQKKSIRKQKKPLNKEKIKQEKYQM